MSGLFSIIIFFIVILITGVVFCMWMLVLGARAVGGLISWIFAPNRIARMTHQSPTIRCPTHGCQAMNPSDARFCRRCGRGLPGAQRVQVRRAAVW